MHYSNVHPRSAFLLMALLISLLSCQAQEKSDELPYQVGFLIMDGVYNTELTAPYDIFQHTIYRDSIRPMEVFTIARTLDPVRSFEGLRILPDYSYRAEHPPIDILVVPSAEHHLDTDLEDREMIDWVRAVAVDALYVSSHCDGAFVLAQAGLLDDVQCTTFPGDIDRFRERFPQLDVLEDVWLVQDGKYLSSAGGARSFEAALYLCHLLYGPAVTRRLARGLVLPWEPESLIGDRIRVFNNE